MLVATGLASAAVERRKAGARRSARRRTRDGAVLVVGAYRRSASLLVRGQNIRGFGWKILGFGGLRFP